MENLKLSGQNTFKTKQIAYIFFKGNRKLAVTASVELSGALVRYDF